jgi:hypothetical protein
MYARDVPLIKQFVEENGPDGLLAVGAFVLSTIQTPLSRTKVQVQDIKQCGIQSAHLWGFKREGYRHLQDNRVPLYQKLVERPVGRSEALLELLPTPGLGLVKAGFFLQCLGYETACMDVHNIKRYGLNPNQLKVGKVTQKTLFKKVDNYVNLCDSLGSSQSHWDDWCLHVADTRMNRTLPTADRVSAFHYEVIAA